MTFRGWGSKPHPSICNTMPTYDCSVGRGGRGHEIRLFDKKPSRYSTLCSEPMASFLVFQFFQANIEEEWEWDLYTWELDY